MEKFRDAGLEIEDYKLEVPTAQHRLLPEGINTKGGGDWNGNWQRFFDQNPQANADQILDHLDQMIDQYGLRGQYETQFPDDPMLGDGEGPLGPVE